jgi:hypothetical protein
MPKHASSIAIATLIHCRFMTAVIATSGPIAKAA